LTLANVQVSQDGAYACTVTNTLNGIAVSSTSTAATLTVVAPPGVPLVSAPTAVVAGIVLFDSHAGSSKNRRETST
jgi:hypothetical protein